MSVVSIFDVNKRLRVGQPLPYNRPTPGEQQLVNDVFADCAVVEVRKDDMIAGNLMSDRFCNFLVTRHFDSYSAHNSKLCKTLDRFLGGVDAFEGESLTIDHLKEYNPEIWRMIEFCQLEGGEMFPFIHGYFPSLRGEGTDKCSYLAFHGDSPNAQHRNGIEPYVRLGLTRFAKLEEGAKEGNSLQKKMDFRRVIAGPGPVKYDRFSLALEDGDVMFLGPQAAGKFSNIQHQAMIHKRDSVSLMIDITFPRGSRFHGWTIPQFADYVVRCDVFAGKEYLNIRYGK